MTGYVFGQTSQSLLPPLKQLKSGTDINHVQCKIGFKLIVKKETSSPVCVKLVSVLPLVDRSWGQFKNAGTSEITADDVTWTKIAAIISLDSSIQSLPDSAFTKNQTVEDTKSILHGMLVSESNGVIIYQQEHDIRDSLNTLMQLRTMTDGSTGGSSADDLITDPGAQKQILPLLDSRILSDKKDLNLA